jgi:hypothetical protein
MLDVYGTIVVGLIVDRCDMLHLSVISTNRGLVFASSLPDDM